MEHLLNELCAKKIITTTHHGMDLKHLLSAERAARGSFYATRVGFVAINSRGERFARSHNGFPIGIPETCERWSKGQKDFYHLHAECAGVFHALRKGYACDGATAYVSHPPCPGCMRALVASGFKRVVFSEQALLERPDWREDMARSFHIANEHHIELSITRDEACSLNDADVTRTELQLKKVYDDLLPQARGSSGDKHEISRATKPESSDWIEHPVIAALLRCAKNGMALGGKGVVMDYPPECRAATAMIQAGIVEVIVCRNPEGAVCDERWAVPLEVERAQDMLQNDAHIKITYADNIERVIEGSCTPQFLNAGTMTLSFRKIMSS